MKEKQKKEKTPRPRRKESERYKIAKLTIAAVAVGLMTAACFVLPLRPAYSEREKRKLTEFPAFSPVSLLSGEYYAQLGAWFSDTVPFRDELVAANAKLEHLMGTAAVRRGFQEGVRGDEIPDVPTAEPESTTEQPATDLTTTAPPTTVPPTTVPPTTAPPATEPPAQQNLQKLSGIVIYGNAGYEYYNFVQSAADNYAAAVNRAAELLAGKATVYGMVIPTSMDILVPESVRAQLSISDQQKAIAYIESLFSPAVRKVSIFNTMKAHAAEYIYFRTDHHWTGLGAYYAYRDFCAVKGVTPVELSACKKLSFDGFLGSFYNDSGMDPVLGNAPDVVETFQPPVNTYMSVTDSAGNVVHPNVIYDSTNSKAAYKYSAFIYGDNPFTVIENTDMAAGESCLLIKDSFGNAFAPLLPAHYKYVYVMDYRSFSGTVAGLVDQYGITDVIIANNISMTRDKNQVQKLTDRVG